MQENKYPLATIGIPTYNRGSLLQQALQSAVSQDYPNLEIVISDNCSTDNTAEVCKLFCSRYPNIIYFKQDSNRGNTANFNTVLKLAKGNFFMWLGDDDWIDTNYIRECVETLMANPDASIVAGQAKYYGRSDRFLYTGIIMNIASISPKKRVSEYFSTVKHNGIFYGVIPKDLIAKEILKNEMGGDLLLMASLAFKGKMYTLMSCSVHRRRGGESSNSKALTKSMSLPWLDYYFPRLSVAKNVFRHIIYSPSFIHLTLVDRFILAIQCIFAAFTRKALSVLFKRRFIEQSGM